MIIKMAYDARMIRNKGIKQAENSGKLASLLSSKVVSKIGPRLELIDITNIKKSLL